MIQTAIQRPVGVLVGVLLTVIFGLLSIRGVPIQLTPDIEVPSLTVETNWPGAAPAEVEREILVPQEEVLKSVQGLKKMTAEARQDRGTITLELEVGTDLDEALVRVTNRLAQVPRYPEAADQPVVSTADAAGPPLAVVLLRAKDRRPVSQYRTWFENEGMPRLERIKGVAKIDFFGGRDTEIHVEFDPDALAARGIPIGTLANAVRAELADVSGGDVTLGKRSFVVRTIAAPAVLTELERVVVATGTDGEPVRLGDVARVREGLRKRNAYVFNNDIEAIALLFRREAGSNVLEVTEEILAEVGAVQSDLLDPVGLELVVVNDQSGYIYDALALVRSNLLMGGVLAIVVLLAFLRSFRASAVVAVAIPVSVIGTALGMSLLGRTVNIVSLAGMAFAVGMVVDNAIVVMESIDTWRGRAPTIAEAAHEGTREVWGALVASTLTTVAVFLPIAMWQDTVGELLRDVAVAVSCAVLISLVVSVLVIPSFAARFVKDGSEGDATPGRFATAVGAVAAWFSRGLARAGCLSIGVVAVTALLAFLLTPPMEYLPTGNRNLLFGILVPPPGYSVDEMVAIGQDFQDGIARHVGTEVDGVPSIERTFFVARNGQAFMGASATNPDEIGALVQTYRQRQGQIPGVFGVASQASLFGRGVGSSRAIDVQLGGTDLRELVGAGGKLMGMLREALPGAQIRPIPSLDLGAPELQIRPRRVDGARLGMSGAALGAAVDALVDGAIIGELGREGQPNLRVVLTAENGGVKDASDLLGASVATPRGEVVPVASLAEAVETTGPTTIQRIERRRAITLQVSPPEDMALEAAMNRIRDEIVPAAQLPSGVRVVLAGTADDLTVAKGKFGQVLLLAVVISFLLMAALFEDFLAPLVILVTVPMAAAGGVIGLRLVDTFLGGQPLDMMTAVGFVLLIGVVVNNAILVVDAALARLREGIALEDAVRSAVVRRVRPILMSSLTSLAGLLPLVLVPGSGSELYRGVGAVVLGGLSLATALTMFVVPALFTVVWRLARRA
ncbi:MAG: efflux RND transporter permease subunit [Alphaproteobacteria bacterium]|nr:efflux RND transporter permease subunit [Alphaproteobacteria bacterium]